MVFLFQVEEYSDEIFDALDKGAHIYFCGLKGMMPGIQDMLEAVCKSKSINFEEYCEFFVSGPPSLHTNANSRGKMHLPVLGLWCYARSYNLLTFIVTQWRSSRRTTSGTSRCTKRLNFLNVISVRTWPLVRPCIKTKTAINMY
jgi:hypothetical protein